MHSHFARLRNVICWLCFAIFLARCEPSPEKSEKIRHKSYIVEIKDMKFQPAELVVHTGDTVVWINKDIVAHDVTEEPAKAWASSPLATGQSWSLVVTKSANYYCSIHVVMKGKLIVE